MVTSPPARRQLVFTGGTYDAMVTTPLARDEPHVLAAPTIGAAWLGVARRILDQGIETRYDGLPVREISLVTLAVSRPDPDDEIITRHAVPERLAWMHANFTDGARVAALGGADSYATRLFDYEHGGRDQVAWVVDRLRRDPATRSAAITTFQPHTDTTYIPCVSLLDFWLPGGAVELVTYAHSIDFGAKGYGNLVEFASLQHHVAGQLGVPVGRLLMIVKSAHVYATEEAYMRGILAGLVRLVGDVRGRELTAPGGLGQAAGFLQPQAAGLRREPVDGRAAHQVPAAHVDDRGARARAALRAELGIPAHQREPAHLQLDGVRHVHRRAAHQREHVEGELAALDLGLAQVDLVAPHDRDGVDLADRAEPAAPVGAAHDGHHPAHWLARRGGRGDRHVRRRRLQGQVAGQGGQRPAPAGDGGGRGDPPDPHDAQASALDGRHHGRLAPARPVPRGRPGQLRLDHGGRRDRPARGRDRGRRAHPQHVRADGRRDGVRAGLRRAGGERVLADGREYRARLAAQPAPGRPSHPRAQLEPDGRRDHLPAPAAGPRPGAEGSPPPIRFQLRTWMT